MVKMIKILCVNNDRSVLNALSSLLVERGNYEILVAESAAAGFKILENEADIHMVIAALRTPEMSGVEFLRQAHERWPETMRIVLSDAADTGAMVAAVNQGEIDKFILQPWNDDELLQTISSALDSQALRFENKQLSQKLQSIHIELEQAHKSLEQQVAKRTEALDIRNRILQVSQGVLDVLPVVVFGIDPEDLIVHCNEYARELFPHGGMGPLGNERKDVFPDEINDLIDRLETERLPRADITVRKQMFRAEVRRLHDPRLQGIVLVLIPGL
ncbi:Response regulator receiver domain-containing protein [Desulfuromusa kysingii]|uniref:Response regulator receiver domain-containing protein n=1 Tax=Desulfuromusa kysingii TaxID=37625 RepID=A0A1H3W981_9BACT|nr:response regulator [Desulfuromusa kysingii]SDZ83645.1 Response regulator receiver domain-containing protein [Desulfuromusa kysingii]